MTRYVGKRDRTIVEGVTEGRNKATKASTHLGSGVASRENDGRTDQDPVYPRLHLSLCNCRWARSRAPWPITASVLRNQTKKITRTSKPGRNHQKSTGATTRHTPHWSMNRETLRARRSVTSTAELPPFWNERERALVTAIGSLSSAILRRCAKYLNFKPV